MGDPGPQATLVPIGRFARLAGLTVPQLRHYDRRGILVPATRDRRSGYRYYSEAQAALESIDRIISEGELMEHDDACSFCGRTPEEARTSLAAGAARICHL